MQHRQKAAGERNCTQTKRRVDRPDPAGCKDRAHEHRRDSLIKEHSAEKAVKSVVEAAPPEPEQASLSAAEETSASSRTAITVPLRACACLDCRPDLYLQTTHAHELQRFQRTTHQLGLFQHDSLQLAELAIASFDGSAGYGHYSETRKKGAASVAKDPGLLAFAQHHAIRRWKHWLQDPEAQVWRTSPDLSKYDPNAILRTPIVVFNELFFLGQLPATVQTGGSAQGFLDIQWSPPDTSYRGRSHTTSKDNDLPVRSLIRISPHHRCHFLAPKDLLGTLLHELCHTFFQRHSCYMGGGEGCDRNQVCVELCQENHGASAHGRAWQKLAAAIEEAAPRLLEGLQADLGRDEGAVREIERMGEGWWPTDCDFAAFGEEFRWELRALMHSRDGAVFEQVRGWVLKGKLCPKKRPSWMRRRNSI